MYSLFAFAFKVVSDENIGIKGFFASKKHLQWGLTLWSLNQDPNAYPSKVAWRVSCQRIFQLTFVHASLHLLDLDDSLKMNIAWLDKDCLVSDLQEHARLVQ